MLVKLDTSKKNFEEEPIKRHVIVIGAGFGGLAAAMRMGSKGYRVTVLEKLDIVGGRG